VIAVDGRPLPREIPRLYLLLNKPRGPVTTRRDPHAGQTVMDLVLPALKERAPADPAWQAAVAGLHPVGRLDAGTEGLLLLTNDGELTRALTHPSHEVEKTYLAQVQGVPSEAALARLRQGIHLESRRTAPAGARLLETDRRANRSTVEVRLHEGRKRQVRLMLAAVGHPVVALRRVQLGPLGLGNLRPREWRMLSGEEVEKLWRAARCATQPQLSSSASSTSASHARRSNSGSPSRSARK
jgi:pseudouridine synthase